MQAEFSFASSVVPYTNIMCVWVGEGGWGWGGVLGEGGWGWGGVLGEGGWGWGGEGVRVEGEGVITGSTAMYA